MNLTDAQWNAIDAAAIAYEQDLIHAKQNGAETMTLAAMKSHLDTLKAMLEADEDAA